MNRRPRRQSDRRLASTTLTVSRCSQVPNALSPRKVPRRCQARTNTSWVSSSARAGSPSSRRQMAYTRPACDRYSSANASASPVRARRTVRSLTGAGLEAAAPGGTEHREAASACTPLRCRSHGAGLNPSRSPPHPPPPPRSPFPLHTPHPTPHSARPATRDPRPATRDPRPATRDPRPASRQPPLSLQSTPMSYFDTDQPRAAGVILILGAFLTIALWPFTSGLIGALVLYVIFAPVYRELVSRIPEGPSAAIVIVLAILLVVLPVASIISLVASQGPGMVRNVIESPLIDRLMELRVGPYNVGEQLGVQFRNVGGQLVSFVGSNAVGLVGSATRLGLQLTVAFFGLYYLLRGRRGSWQAI